MAAKVINKDAERGEDEHHVITNFLEHDDPRFLKIKNNIVSSLRFGYGKDLDILWVEEVINDALLSRYILAKEDLELTCGNNLQELQLFHGTKMDCLRKIMREGFKKSCNWRSSQGVGTYLAKDPSTSLGYIIPDEGIHFLFLCDVLVGRCCPHTKPENEIEYFDVFVNTQTNPTVFVVPYDNAIYPRYVIALGPKGCLHGYPKSYFATFKIPVTPPKKGDPIKRTNRSGFSQTK